MALSTERLREIAAISRVEIALMRKVMRDKSYAPALLLVSARSMICCFRESVDFIKEIHGSL